MRHVLHRADQAIGSAGAVVLRLRELAKPDRPAARLAEAILDLIGCDVLLRSAVGPRDGVAVLRMDEGQVFGIGFDALDRHAQDLRPGLRPDVARLAADLPVPGADLRVPLGLDEQGPAVGQRPVRTRELRNLHCRSKDILGRARLILDRYDIGDPGLLAALAVVAVFASDDRLTRFEDAIMIADRSVAAVADGPQFVDVSSDDFIKTHAVERLDRLVQQHDPAVAIGNADGDRNAVDDALQDHSALGQLALALLLLVDL